MSFKIGDISLGKSSKRYTRPVSFDNNTTMDFGFCQPLFCQLLLENSDISVSLRQLVRLAPMPVPSFARVSLVNKFVFVPWSDVCPYYEALLSNIPYGPSKVIPTKLPYITNDYLIRVLLTYLGTYATCYYVSAANGKESLTQVTDAVETKVYANIAKEWCADMKVKDNDGDTFEPVSYKRTDSKEPVAPNSADYLYRCSATNMGEGVYAGEVDYVVAFKFDGQARHIRQILLGLGYSLTMYDTTPVNALPIFAYYKAWFDTYAPKRTMSWTDTNAYQMIHSLFDSDYKPDLAVQQDSETYPYMFALLYDLAGCYYVADDDFVSVHRDDLQTVSNNAVSFVESAYDGINNNAVTQDTSNANPTYFPTTDSNAGGAYINNVGLQTLQRLSRFVNKDSVIGQRISRWVSNHFGASVANSLYRDVYQVHTSIVPLQINDVFSTSDTADEATQQGEVLGAYAGKGIGFDNSQFKFHADKRGYLFCMSSVVPKMGYFQGTDTSLYGLDRFTLPNPDFDAVGMEVTPSGFVLGDNGYTSESKRTRQDFTAGFGYVPRYSGYKVKKNIVNGDMSLRSTIDSMSPYYLDRIVQTGDVLYTKLTSGAYEQKSIYPSRVPRASEKWRYPTRYSWLGDPNRMFYNASVYHGASAQSPLVAEGDLYDNFIVQNLFEFKIIDFLKPISMSFDTYEETTDNTTQNVSPE